MNAGLRAVKTGASLRLFDAALIRPTFHLCTAGDPRRIWLPYMKISARLYLMIPPLG
jgi:hypothetical protein